MQIEMSRIHQILCGCAESTLDEQIVIATAIRWLASQSAAEIGCSDSDMQVLKSLTAKRIVDLSVVNN